jgi:hypothetical protein
MLVTPYKFLVRTGTEFRSFPSVIPPPNDPKAIGVLLSHYPSLWLLITRTSYWGI